MLTLDQVMEEYDYYVESQLLQYGVKPDDFADLKQEVWLRVHASAMLADHDPSRAKISTRLWPVVRSVVLTAQIRARSKGRNRAVAWPHRDWQVGDAGRGAQEVERTAILNDLIRKLDPCAATVVTMLCEGFRASQIAKVVGRSEQTIRNICRRLEHGELVVG